MKKVIALLLTLVLVLSFSVTAFADPSYSPDGVTCTGDGCHGTAAETPAPTPAPAPTVEEEPAAEETAAAEAADHTKAAEAMAEIALGELFPEGVKDAETQEILFQRLVDYFIGVLSLLEFLAK